jgi:hypothetical protein
LRKLFILLIGLLICSNIFATTYKDIASVSVGDSESEVRKKLGEPKYLLSPGIIVDGKRQSIWVYGVGDGEEKVAYHIIFTEHKVTAIDRQQQKLKDEQFMWSPKYILNGHSIVAAIEKEGDAGRERASLYINGAVDALFSSDLPRMKVLYGFSAPETVVNKVIEYYQKNPTQRQQNVVDVILSGCK